MMKWATERGMITFRKDLPDGSVLLALVRYDDECRNGHNTFSITCDVYDKRGGRREPALKNAAGRTQIACKGVYDFNEEELSRLHKAAEDVKEVFRLWQTRQDRRARASFGQMG